MQPRAPNQLLTVNPADLTEMPGEPLGEGGFGKVVGVEYKGADPELLAMAQRGALIVKSFKREPDEDVVINPYLHQLLIHDRPDLRGKFTVGVVREKEGKPVIIGNFVSYNGYQSSDLEKFIYGTMSYGSEARKNTTAFAYAFEDTNVATSLVQLMASMKISQDALHEAGVFHLDTSPRNFLLRQAVVNDKGSMNVSAVINDFGLSRRIPPNGVVPFTPELEKSRWPLRYMDSRAINRDGFSIATDYYALRISMMENVCHALNIPLDSILWIQKPDEGYMNTIIQRQQLTDEFALAKFTDHLMVKIENCNNPAMKLHLQLFVKSFRDYLTSMPPKSDTYTPEQLRAIRQEDGLKFSRALDNFSQMMQEEMIRSPQLFGNAQRLATRFPNGNAVHAELNKNQSSAPAPQPAAWKAQTHSSSADMLRRMGHAKTHLQQRQAPAPTPEQRLRAEIQAMRDLLKVLKEIVDNKDYCRGISHDGKMPKALGKIRDLLGKEMIDSMPEAKLRAVLKKVHNAVDKKNSRRTTIARELYDDIKNDRVGKLIVVRDHITSIEAARSQPVIARPSK